jgi:hypothetical protein
MHNVYFAQYAIQQLSFFPDLTPGLNSTATFYYVPYLPYNPTFQFQLFLYLTFCVSVC